MKDQYTLGESDELIRLREAWSLVLQRLKEEVPATWFERFIRPLVPVRLVDRSVSLNVPGKFIAEWVRSRYEDTLSKYFSDELGYDVRVELNVVAQSKDEAAETADRVIASTAPTQHEEPKFKPNEKYSFESFVVGQSNRMAFAGAKAVADEPGTRFNPLFIYGASGLGKTHLLHSIAREVLKRDPNTSLVYVTAQRFAEAFVHALQNNKTDAFRRSHRNVQIWLVDDIQFIAGKDKTSEEIFHTFNHLHTLDKQIVICSDRPPRELYLMDERLRSRFEAGLVADIQMPDTETRMAILLSKAAQERVELELPLAQFLAENVPGNIRTLEGALTRLIVQASVCNKPLSIDLAAEMVEQHFRAGTLAKPSVKAIIGAVGKHFKIDPTEIHGASRKAPIVHARHIAIYITRELTGDSWKHIGSQFGDRDHTSMMHGYQKIAELMNQDKDLSSTVKMLLRNLYPDA